MSCVRGSRTGSRYEESTCQAFRACRWSRKGNLLLQAPPTTHCELRASSYPPCPATQSTTTFGFPHPSPPVCIHPSAAHASSLLRKDFEPRSAVMHYKIFDMSFTSRARWFYSRTKMFEARGRAHDLGLSLTECIAVLGLQHQSIALPGWQS